LSNENNVEKFDWYKKYSKLPVKEIEAAVMTKQMSHHEELTFRQKLCLYGAGGRLSMTSTKLFDSSMIQTPS
jgi:hypothetical protein